MTYPTAAELYQPRNLGLSLVDRLFAHTRVEPDGCWRWLGSRTTAGYGHLSTRGSYYQAHRLMFSLWRGDVPDGLELDHLCRHRWCVNPSHLEIVTHAVNAQRGSRSVLSLEKVRAIRAARADGVGVRELGRRYHVNHATISRICRGLTWPTPSEGNVA
jgi:hypothetical protein